MSVPIRTYEEKPTYDSILDEAKEITGGDRMKQYGHPRDNFQDIADLWEAYLGVKITASQVAMMMCLFKIARQKAGHKRDNLTDLAGYARNAAQIEGIE